MMFDMKTIAVIGLGYVGLPLAVEFGKSRPVIGFDINQAASMHCALGATQRKSYQQKSFLQPRALP